MGSHHRPNSPQEQSPRRAAVPPDVPLQSGAPATPEIVEAQAAGALLTRGRQR